VTDPYQVYDPPSYPEDRFLTQAEMEAKQRAMALLAGTSPNVRICIMDQFVLDRGPYQNPNIHLHTYAEYMNWRHNNIDPRTGAIVADGDPWTAWMTYDDWAQIAPPQGPFGPQPIPPVGWNYRARVNPNGISQMQGWWNVAGMWGDPSGTTIVVHVGPDQVQLLEGLQTRLTLSGVFSFIDCYIGRSSLADPFVATEMHYVSFNGGQNGAAIAASPGAPFGQVVSDPLPIGINAINGLLVSFYTGLNQPSNVGYRTTEPGWTSRVAKTNLSANPDKSGTAWTTTPVPYAVTGLLSIEAYYLPP
jgi:hypothetical protein